MIKRYKNLARTDRVLLKSADDKSPRFEMLDKLLKPREVDRRPFEVGSLGNDAHFINQNCILLQNERVKT